MRKANGFFPEKKGRNSEIRGRTPEKKRRASGKKGRNSEIRGRTPEKKERSP